MGWVRAHLLPSSLLGRFFLLTFLWLPFWFVLWYQLSGALSIPAVLLSQHAVNLFHPGLIETAEGLGRHVHYGTALDVPMPDAPDGTRGQLLVAVNPLVYSWNLPVLFALLFAADERFFSVTRVLIAYVGLLPLHTWGISFELLSTLALRSGADVQAALGLAGWRLEAVALGYQFGYLMLPVIGAATLWIAMNRDMLRELLDPGQDPPHPPPGEN